MLTAIADRAFIGDDPLPRSNDEFMKLKQRARTRLPAVSEGLARQVQAIAAEYQLLAAKQGQMPATVNRLKRDVGQQLEWLLYQGCFGATPWEHLQHLPRYLKALRLRIEKHPGNPDRDGRHAQAVGVLWENWRAEVEKQKKADRLTQELMDFRWLIEELRVSLFAQELKTPFPISIKRLEKIWNDIRI
jgi:ATP-dependent helicase HrpA